MSGHSISVEWSFGDKDENSECTEHARLGDVMAEVCALLNIRNDNSNEAGIYDANDG